MEKINDNINSFLPFGESLRAILQHDSIKDRERRQLLRMKGVFVNNSDEDSTFPILTNKDRLCERSEPQSYPIVGRALE